MRAVRVAVRAADPLTDAGLRTWLEEHPRIMLTALGEAEVAVVPVTTVETSVLHLLRGLPTPAGSRLVLIVSGGGQADLVAAEPRIRAVLWRPEVDAAALARTVRDVAAGRACLPSAVQGRVLDQLERIQQPALQDRRQVPPAETTSPVRAHEYDAATVRGMRAEDPGPYASPAERTLPTSSRAAGRRFLEPGGLPGPGPDGCGAPAGEPVFAGRFLNPVRTRAGVGLLSPARPPPGPCQAGRQQACQPELDRDGDHAPGHRPAASELRSRGPAQPRVRLHGQHSSAPHTSNKVPPHTVRHTYSSDRKQERKSNGGSDDHGRDIK
ncbi:hypothetical protein [Streptomyces griseoruber]|uniref:hypothetical protein n=1 Tax=Streptomyces griseoruber TaxID=1943 RepID=UPI0037A7D50E